MSMWTHWRNLVGQVIYFTLGIFLIIAKSPSVVVSEPPMMRSLCVEVLIMSEYLWRWQHPKSLWSYSGIKLVSPLHCASYGVSPGRISGQLYKSWCMHFRIILLVRGNLLSCSWGVGDGDELVVIFYCLGRSFPDAYIVSSSWDIMVDLLVEVIFIINPCVLVNFSPFWWSHIFSRGIVIYYVI